MDDSFEWLYYSRGYSRPENLKKRPGQKKSISQNIQKKFEKLIYPFNSFCLFFLKFSGPL